MGHTGRLLREESAEVDPGTAVLNVALHDAHGKPLPLAGGEKIVLQNLPGEGAVRHEIGENVSGRCASFFSHRVAEKMSIALCVGSESCLAPKWLGK